MLRIVMDTGVLISALIAGGKPRRLLNEALKGRVELVISREILDEFYDVISRPKFAKYVDTKDIKKFVRELLKVAGFVKTHSKFRVIKEDPEDSLSVRC